MKATTNFRLWSHAGVLLSAGLTAMTLFGQESTAAAPQSRTEITINEENVSPENLTSTKDGTVYFGSTAKGSIYRAAPNAPHAEVWIRAETAGLTNVLGVLADEKSNTLWVCANPPFGRETPATGQVLRAFDLKTGEAKGSYPAPGGGALNDAAVAADGSVYVSEMLGGRILRLKPGAKEIEVWLNNPEIRGIDGLTFLADGSLYFNNYFNGKLSRVAVREDGSAGAVTDIQTSVPLRRPDGMRTTPANTLLQVEGSGRLTEITITGDKGDVRVIKEGLTNAAGVTQIGSTALVLIERKRAVLVPMQG